MSTLKVDKIDPSSGTALEIGSSGDTMTVPSGAQLTVASGATIDVSGCTLTPPATMPASSGENLTALNATQLTSGTVPEAALASSVFPAGHVINIFEYSGTDTSLTSTTTTNTHTLGTATGTSALSSASNKLLIHASVLLVTQSTTSDHHWRIFLTGSGLTHFTLFNVTGIPFNANYHYSHGHYTEDRYSITALCSPGTTTPTYNIEVVEAGSAGTIETKWSLFQYQEIQA